MLFVDFGLWFFLDIGELMSVGSHLHQIWQFYNHFYRVMTAQYMTALASGHTCIVSKQWRLLDRQTDRQTDRISISISRVGCSLHWLSVYSYFREGGYVLVFVGLSANGITRKVVDKFWRFFRRGSGGVESMTTKKRLDLLVIRMTMRFQEFQK